MIGAIFPVGSYASVQRYAQVNPVSTHGAAAAEKSSVVTAHKSFDIETPVQPAEAVKPVVSGVSGNLNVNLSVEKSADAAEMSVRMRMSSAEEESAVQVDQEAEDALREEQLEAEEKAEAKREAYLEELKEEEAAREERIEALQEAQSEEEQPGSLEFDNTAALIQNYQMNNLMQDMLSARSRDEDTTGYSNAINALLESGQNRVRFGNGEAESTDNHRRYQQTVAGSSSAFGAVA